MSVDGKISTGNIDQRDFDNDLKEIEGVTDGLHQYYDLEQRTDKHSLNTGKVMVKIGVNDDASLFNGMDFLSFIIIDNFHLKFEGISNLTTNLKMLYLVTSNRNHPAYSIENHNNLEIIFYEDEIDFRDLFNRLKQTFEIRDLTIQSGGTLNSVLLRLNLIDKLSIVVAPVVVGGKDTHSLFDGKMLASDKDLKEIKALKLIDCQKLENSYLHLTYYVVQKTDL